MSDPHAARRRATPQRRRPSIPRVPLSVVVLLVAAVLVLVTPGDAGSPPREQASYGAPVTQTTLGCPRRAPSPSGVRTSYGVGLAAVQGTGEEGTLQPGLSIRRGEAPTVEASSAEGLDVSGTDGFAQGLFAWRADTGSSTAVADCAAPRASWWFTGVGAALDHESTLTITNLDQAAAVVDIRALSQDGEVDLSATGGTGMTIQPGAHENLPLVELAPQNDELSIWVHATRGRVVAAVTDRYVETPTAPPGFEWLPSQTEPSRLLRLSGVPARAKQRTLLVANPSELESVLTVEVAGPSGRFVPTGLEELSVEPGAVLSVDFSDVLREALAVRLTGTVPVVATLRSLGRDGDIAYAGVAHPLAAPAALPVVGRTALQLTAGNQTSRAQVTAYDSEGLPLDDTRLSVAPHATTTWTAPNDAAYLVVDPVQGAPYGAVVYEGASAIPLHDLPIDIRVPVVRPAA